MRRTETLALGLLHGPVELLPVSSSGHVAAVPWLLGWEVARDDGARRKALEVALHAGTAAALLTVSRETRTRPRPALLAAAVAPPAVAGVLFKAPIEERLGTPVTLAAGLLAGAAALVAADRAPATRDARDAGWRDGLWLGLAQCAALWPGVSRSGATLAVARARILPAGRLTALVGGRPARARGRRRPHAAARRAAGRGGGVRVDGRDREDDRAGAAAAAVAVGGVADPARRRRPR